MVARLRHGAFDAAVIFTVYSQNPLPAAMLCHLAGIPRALAHCRENPYHLLSHWLPETEPAQGIRHEVQRQLDLVAAVGARTAGPRLRVRPRLADRSSMRAKRGARGIAREAGWVVVHAGATAAARRYPEAGFARAISLLDTGGRPVIFTGSGEERALVSRIMA